MVTDICVWLFYNCLNAAHPVRFQSQSYPFFRSFSPVFCLSFLVIQSSILSSHSQPTLYRSLSFLYDTLMLCSHYFNTPSLSITHVQQSSSGVISLHRFPDKRWDTQKAYCHYKRKADRNNDTFYTVNFPPHRACSHDKILRS